jgi:formylglycine-generating enzyme required for sulfatase activity
MKLFISYSREDKTWVYELERLLREKGKHDVWLDRLGVAADDWWRTILENIETSQCFIYVMTQRSLESIFCRAELYYALALNKPILPIMLKTSSYPSELSQRGIEYQTIGENASPNDVVSTIVQKLSQIESDPSQNKYPPSTASRPPMPTPEQKPEQIAEAFMLAEEAASESNFSIAEKLFQQVVDVDPSGKGPAATERLAKVHAERDRYREYLKISQIAKIPALRKRARTDASVYVQKYGKDYDPKNVLAVLLEPVPAAMPQPAAHSLVSIPAPNPLALLPAPPISPQLPSSVEILPGPFAWIDIPAGKVTIAENNYDDSYINKGQEQTFDVPAFAIAKYPITNAQFAKFIEANGYGQRKWWIEAGWQIKEEKAWTEPRFWKVAQWNQPNYPVVALSWFEAMAFCKWLSEVTGQNITLPTEQQWQWAAQGDTNFAYPWGEKMDKTLCNFDTKATTPVQQFEGKGDSPFKVTDMSGNVWEWCATDFKRGTQQINAISDQIVLRGGSWNVFIESLLRVNRRFLDVPVSRNTDLGFRIVRV